MAKHTDKPGNFARELNAEAMSKYQHTVTPWRSQQSINTITIYGKDGQFVAAFGVPHQNHNQANVEHIVKCVNLFPELVGALERAVGYLATCEHYIFDDVTDEEITPDTFAALIAKAKETP